MSFMTNLKKSNWVVNLTNCTRFWQLCQPSYEKKDRRREAASHYGAYLKVVDSGEKAEYAYERLKEWGYLRENPQR